MVGIVEVALRTHVSSKPTASAAKDPVLVNLRVRERLHTMDDDFNSCDIEFDAPPAKFAEAGKASIERTILN
ncbi:hypothetical protein LTR56_005881 [Elasticomyces elasticus]|nr:hypothetical protein LTR56_005881 [Elasticomyces elasticus]KAK3664893.1 hypothetical protein LTR22_004199 [Elasticomyces elasticus]KAK4912780.1 hypothetical protein LTR49_018849 [Elasticomyces elasticus]KAK5752146.1 hypothetical protein LTS12_017741 [Elasticomyces elasticus]